MAKCLIHIKEAKARTGKGQSRKEKHCDSECVCAAQQSELSPWIWSDILTTQQPGTVLWCHPPAWAQKNLAALCFDQIQTRVNLISLVTLKAAVLP